MGDIISKPESKPKKNSLTNSEILEFRNISSFSEQIVIKLHNHYSLFCAVHSDDGVIDYSEFCYLINKSDNNLSRRIFNAIDTNTDKVINFIEFIKFFGCFCSGTFEEKVNLSFKIFSDMESKTIKSSTMNDILMDVIKYERNIKSYLDKETINMIVENTFKNIAPKKKESFDNTLNKDKSDKFDKSLKEKDIESAGKDLIKLKSTNSLIDNSKIDNQNNQNNINKENDDIDFNQYKGIIEKNPMILDWFKLDLEHIKKAKIATSQTKKSKSYCAIIK